MLTSLVPLKSEISIRRGCLPVDSWQFYTLALGKTSPLEALERGGLTLQNLGLVPLLSKLVFAFLDFLLGTVLPSSLETNPPSDS